MSPLKTYLTVHRVNGDENERQEKQDTPKVRSYKVAENVREDGENHTRSSRSKHFFFASL